MITDVIIMAGGFGERLWPASSPSHPKQFMALNDNLSFLQNSIQRALALKITGKIIIVTRKDIEEECTLQCKRLAEAESSENAEKILNDCIVISEPYGRHTSAAIMTGVCFILKNDDKKHTFLVLTSDHVIGPMETFVADCKTAARSAEANNFVCFAIPPTEPSVAYGYIKTGKDIYGTETSYVIDNFKEKPDLETAKQYLASGNYWWNSGMFAFDANNFVTEMKSCTPEITNSFELMFKGNKPEIVKLNDIDIIGKWDELVKVYETVPSIAVDKAIAEKTTHAVAVKANFKWTDVGSWDVFSEMCTNPANLKVSQVQCKNNFVYSDIPVALCGVKDLIVVVKNGALLIMKKGESALVREAAKEMKD